MGLYSCCDVTNPAPETELLYGHRIGGMHGEAAAEAADAGPCVPLTPAEAQHCMSRVMHESSQRRIRQKSFADMVDLVSTTDWQSL
jgi:hypothetical protein